MFSAIPLLYSADPSAKTSLGRITYDLLPEQTLMELMIAGLDDKTKSSFMDGSGEFVDVCQWTGVDCGFKDEIRRINWFSLFCRVSGSLNLECIPRSVVQLVIERKYASSKQGPADPMGGILQTEKLPDSLLGFKLDSLWMRGSVDMTKLPSSLKTFEIPRNLFEGSCDLTALPQSLETFDVYHNSFTGSVSFENLPEVLSELNLSQNFFSGSLSLENLPLYLFKVDISKNSFSGSFVLERVPKQLRSFHAERNAFSGEAVIQQFRGPHMFYLSHNAITRVVTENGKANYLSASYLSA